MHVQTMAPDKRNIFVYSAGISFRLVNLQTRFPVTFNERMALNKVHMFKAMRSWLRLSKSISHIPILSAHAHRGIRP
jgi:hypothetical protein